MKHKEIIFFTLPIFFLINFAIFQGEKLDVKTAEILLGNDPMVSENRTMTNLKLSQIFDGDIQTVVDVLFNDWMQPKDLPNVTSKKVLVEKWEEDKKIIKTEWCIYGKIPKIIQNFLTPKMLTWIEESVWDSKSLIYTYNIKPHYFRKVFTCKGKWTYLKAGKNKTERRLEGVLDVRIPIFGSIVERILARYVYDNFTEEYKIMNKKVKERMRIKSRPLKMGLKTRLP